MKIKDLGYIRIKTISPLIEIGNVSFNVKEKLKEIKTAEKESVSVLVFPELSLTGYTCDDLFHQSYLLDNSKKGLYKILKETKHIDMILIFGMPYQMPDGRLYNTGVVTHKGKILGMTLKKYLPNYSEFYEMRHFSSGINRNYSLTFEDQKFEAGNQVYQVKDKKDKVLFTLGVEICEDLWAVTPPSNDMALSGADLIVNLSASDELVAKHNYRKELVGQQSSRLNCVYAYVSSGPNESVKDCVFGGASMIYENGSLLAEGERFLLEKSSYSIADVDFDKIQRERRLNTTFSTCRPHEQYKIIEVYHTPSTENLNRRYLKNPFLPSEDPKILDQRCEEILNILETGLARQMKGSSCYNLIVGQSGGMDSTLVSLIAKRALNKLNLPIKNLYSISIPGFGTSDRTKKQSKELSKALGSTFMEISLVDEVSQHFQDIKHPKDLYDTVYENSQARARTKMLFNLANKYNGLHISGSSLSEMSQGWSTYGGDSISNYNVLGSVPKSLSKYLIAYEAKKNPELKEVLNQVLETTISPELLPSFDKTKISQSTEASIGKYDVLDFCLYHQIRNGFSKEKIKFLLSHVYKEDSSMTEEEINKTVESYFNRFYKNQFKRTCTPASIKIGIDLSPRASWRMPDLSKYDDFNDE